MLGEGATGAEAVDLGLAYRCVESAEKLLPDALELARRLAAGPTRSLGLSKRLLNASFETDLSRLPRVKVTSRRWRRRHPTWSRAWPPSARSATPTSTARERATLPRIQRIAAYNISSTRVTPAHVPPERHHRTSGLVDVSRRRHRLRRASRSRRNARAARGDRTHGEHRRAARGRLAAANRARRPTAIEGRLPRACASCTAPRSSAATLRDETDESTDQAAWCTRDDVEHDAARRARPARRRARVRDEDRSSKASDANSRFATARPGAGCCPIFAAPRAARRTSRSTVTREGAHEWGVSRRLPRSDVMEVVEPPAGREHRRARVAGPVARQRRQPPDRGRSASRGRYAGASSASRCRCARSS